MSDTPPPNVWAPPPAGAPQWPAPAPGWPSPGHGGPPFGAAPLPQPPTETAPAGSAYHEQARNGRQHVPQRIGEFLLVAVGNLAAPLVVIAFGALAWYVLGLDFAPGDGEPLHGVTRPLLGDSQLISTPRNTLVVGGLPGLGQRA
ncbi:hypothetical protein ACFXAG_01780, partial [Streptomyces yangpuensis]